MSIFATETATVIDNRADAVATARTIASMFTAASPDAIVDVVDNGDDVLVTATITADVHDFAFNVVDTFVAALRYAFDLSRQGAFTESVTRSVVTTDEDTAYLTEVDSRVTAFNGCTAQSLLARAERDCAILRDTYTAV